MKIIVGLGNPGKEYEGTRHNAGFMFVDKLAEENEVSFSENKKFNALLAETSLSSEKVMLVKPQTFMNLSGTSVSKIIDYYKENIGNIFVVSDDVDLPLGKVRIRTEGASGGHNGLQNIIDTLGNDHFNRIRIGVGPNLAEPSEPSQIDTKDYVLAKFDKREEPVIRKVIGEMVNYIISSPISNFDQISAHTINIE